MAPTEITRRGMYDLVWSKPMTKTARDFGISDVALKKICLKYRVSSPPRGYWARKEAGKPVKQIGFVETADPDDERITIYGRGVADLPEPIRKVLDEARAARRSRLNSSVPAPSTAAQAIVETHSAVTATAKVL